MKICFIADANSIHARRWIEYFCKPENEIHIISTKYCTRPVKSAIVHNLPRGGRGSKGLDGIGVGEDSAPATALARRSSVIRFGQFLHRKMIETRFYYFANLLFRVLKFRGRARAIVEKLRPDIVQCLRLPIEGYLGGLVGRRPLALQTWGNDMVYFAQKYRIFRWLTRKAMSQADLYFSDSLRDKYIAENFGFSPASPVGLMPVTGGLKFDELPVMNNKDSATMQKAKQKLRISPQTNLLISVRGFKDFYVHTETLVRAVPRILQEFPDTIFVLKGGTQFSGYFEQRKLARRLGVEGNIRFVDRLPVEGLIDYFTAADIMVSVTLYDGCPVSMLEGMAFGIIPAMSVHSPITEWITDGWNGYLFDPEDPADIAQAILRALRNKVEFGLMRERNWEMLRDRADFYKNMKIAEEMYQQVVGKPGISG